VRRSRLGEPSESGARQKGRIRGGIEDGLKGGQSDAAAVILGHRWWEKEGRSERARGGQQHDLYPFACELSPPVRSKPI
jgi:hypothetical protein